VARRTHDEFILEAAIIRDIQRNALAAAAKAVEEYLLVYASLNDGDEPEFAWHARELSPSLRRKIRNLIPKDPAPADTKE
jgi:hypothetical protein